MKESNDNIYRVAKIYGNKGIMVDSTNIMYKIMLKSSSTRLYVGDYLEPENITDQICMIDNAKPRVNIIERFDKLGKKQIIASNVSQILVVIAPQPNPNFLLLDKLLLTSELKKNKASIIYNKNDVSKLEDDRILRYKILGYDLLDISAKSKNNLKQLHKQLINHTSILVGQSGVGKSTITNMLITDEELKTRRLSSKTNKGRHTTSTTSLYTINENSHLIDTPGVENLYPAIDSIDDIQLGFREMRSLIGNCKYRDCLHLSEPSCAIKDNLQKGHIDALRYENYKKLIESYRKTLNQ